MGLFERLPSGGYPNAGNTKGKEDAAAQEALRLIDEGNAIEDEGRIDEALQRYETAIRLAPRLARAHLNLGNIRMLQGDTLGAVNAFSEALRLNPEYAAAHFNVGNAQVRSGSVEAAVASYRKALALKPDFAEAELALGAVLEDLGHREDAAASYRRALTIAPALVDAHYKLGNVLTALGQFDAAVTSYRRALAINLDFAEAHCSLGNVLKELGQFDSAVGSYRRALEINPDFAEAHSNLGAALRELRQPDAAVRSFRRALEIRPTLAEVHYNLAKTLKGLGQLDEAVASYRRAIALKPDLAVAHYNLANALRDLRLPRDAVASYRQALRISDDYPDAYNNMGNALLDLGEMDEAATSYRRALQIKPDSAMAGSNLLFCLSHLEAMTPEKLFAEHCRFGAQFETPLRVHWPRHRNPRDPNRCLQVGFVSGDLHDHAVAYFIEPVLAHLANCRSLSLHAYYNHPVEDVVTKRMRGYFNHWHAIAQLSDEGLAQRIGADGIDILIDLSGHTGETRLLTFARKPAPVQASWIGYPGTTGLRAMDYYFADHHFLPARTFERQFTERLVYLPAVAPFLPDPSSPPVNSLPALANGYVTFGSFNRLSKLTPFAVALWSRLLRALPDARMLVGGMPEDTQPNPLVTWFAQQGIARERLSLQSRCRTAAYLALHHQVDVCLDTFPYTGGTTTNHALWMGVPTLSLAGPTAPGRQGAAMLGHVGLEQFVANDAADFEQKGLRWAGDLEALACLRAELRQRYEQSLLRDPGAIAVGLERALRIMWQRWCAGLPAQALDVSGPSVGALSIRD